MAHCQSSYFPKHLFTADAAIRWREEVGQSPINPAHAECERYGPSRQCPRGPCGSRPSWSFMPGQIANWKWSVDFAADDPRHFHGPYNEGNNMPNNYCVNHRVHK